MKKLIWDWKSKIYNLKLIFN